MHVVCCPLVSCSCWHTDTVYEVVECVLSTTRSTVLPSTLYSQRK